MFSDRPLLTAIIVSVVVHLVILFQIPGLRYIITQQDKPGDIEIKYVAAAENKPENKQSALPKPALRGPREPLLKFPSQVIGKNTSLPAPSIDKQETFGKKRAIRADERIFKKPILFKPDIGAVKKKITLAPPKDNLNKINSPSYIGYFQLTREKVRRVLYQKYTYTEEGEVYLSFVVSHSGNIKDVRVDESRTSASPYLREIAIASVRDASPFPLFPKDLEYPELTFNVVISFEVE